MARPPSESACAQRGRRFVCFFRCEQTLPAGDLQSFHFPSECTVCFETSIGLGLPLSYLVIKPLAGPGGSMMGRRLTSSLAHVIVEDCGSLFPGAQMRVQMSVTCAQRAVFTVICKKGRWPVMEGTQETSVLLQYTERWGNWASPSTSLENY